MTFRRLRFATSAALVGGLIIAPCGPTLAAGRPHQGSSGVTPPLTPGAVALLGSATDAAALETVRQALTNDDPMMRAVAARLVATTRQSPLADTVAAVFQNEQDADAAAEQTRALLFIRGAAAAETIEPRILSGEVASVYAEWIARNRPERLAELMPKLAAAFSGDPTGLNPFILKVLGARPDLSEPVFRINLQSTTPSAWRALLNRLTPDQMTRVQPVILEGLSSQDADIRTETVWSVVTALAQGLAISPTLLDAIVMSFGTTAADAPVTWELWGRELVARRHGRKDTPDRSALLKAEAAQHLMDSRRLSSFEPLLDSERKALKAALGDFAPRGSGEGPGTERTERIGAPMRTIPVLWPGFVKSLLAAADCRTGSGTQFGLASAGYRPDGTVASGRVSSEGLPPGCSKAMSALLRMTIADSSYWPPQGVDEVLVLPLGSRAVECASKIDANAGKPVRLGPAAKIAPPRKVRDVRPVYPDQLQKRGVQGAVVLEAVITATGCVSYLTVLKSSDPMLDFAALSAVSGWEFAPSTVDGRKIPVLMTITVNFNVQ